MFTIRINMSLPLQDWVDKTFREIETYWLSGEEKVRVCRGK